MGIVGRSITGGDSNCRDRRAHAQQSVTDVKSFRTINTPGRRQVHRELSVAVRKSEAVALGHPVVPVADGFVG
jgi:hypothetical protein